MDNDLLPKLEEWSFVDLDREREKYLQKPIEYSDLVSRIADESIVSEPKHEPCDENRRDSPGFGASRWVWCVSSPSEVFDQFYNSRFGLRAHYWRSADFGRTATKTFLDAMEAKVRSACSEQVRVDAMQSYFCRSSKVWPLEKGLEGKRALIVARWVESERSNGSPHQWRWTPNHGQLEIKGGFRHPNGGEYVPVSKQDREERIHLTGWSGQRPDE